MRYMLPIIFIFCFSTINSQLYVNYGESKQYVKYLERALKGNKVFDIDPYFKGPSEYSVAFLSTEVLGDPNETIDRMVTSKFEKAFKEMGFKVVDSYFVDAVINELGAEGKSKLSLSNMQELQKQLNIDLICVSSLHKRFVPSQSSGSSTGSTDRFGGISGGDFISQGGYYTVVNETLKLIDPKSLSNVLSITQVQSTDRGKAVSISDDIIFILKDQMKIY